MEENIIIEAKRYIETVEQKCKDKKLAAMFRKCFLNTLETTVRQLKDGTTYVITGDIQAMWLRDSAAQVRPYLYLANSSKALSDMIVGLIKRQFQYIDIDPYANAFNQQPDGACWEKDETLQNDWVWERKYEIDSLCYPIQLAYLLWKRTGRTDQFDKVFQTAVKKIIKVFQIEQHHEEQSGYRFIRPNTYFQDTLSREGKGALVRDGIGLIWSGFRPSDDACVYGYLIPSNMFASVVLGYVKEVAAKVLNDMPLSQMAGRLSEEIKMAIETYGVTEKEGFGKIYAYEVDGYGQYQLMDDANVPSLLSMSYLGYKGDPAAMGNTRKFILSEANPYYYEGTRAKGIGSLHTPMRYVWHIAIAMEGLTSSTAEERKRCLYMLAETDGGTGYMHEGIDVDNPVRYTRPWFSWANAMFCELFMRDLGEQEFVH